MVLQLVAKAMVDVKVEWGVGAFLSAGGCGGGGREGIATFAIAGCKPGGGQGSRYVGGGKGDDSAGGGVTGKTVA